MEDLKGKNTEAQVSDQEQATRQSRRKLLKTGAAMAPLALTLSTGNAFAGGQHAVSGAACVQDVVQRSRHGDPDLQIPSDYSGEGLYQYSLNNEEGDSRMVNFDDRNANHWDYLKQKGGDGCSCLLSVNVHDYMQNADG